MFTYSYLYRVQGGFQADITLTSSINLVKIFGENLDAPYKAKDSAFIYALDYVDKFLKVEIIDINQVSYLMKRAGVSVIRLYL